MRKISMQKRTFLSFMSIFVLFAIAIGGTTFGLNKITVQLENSIQKDLEVKDLLRQLSSNKMDEESINKELISKAKSIPLSYGQEMDLEGLSSEYAKYLEQKNKEINFSKKEVTLNNNLKNYIQEIESLYNKHAFDANFKVPLLLMERYFETYQKSWDTKEFSKSKEQAEIIKNLLVSRNYIDPVKGEITSLLNQFTEGFEQLVSNHTQIIKIKNELSQDVKLLEESVKKSVLLVNNKSNERLREVNEFKKEVYLGIGIGAGVIALFILFFQINFSKSIKSIIQLSGRLRDSAKSTEKSSANMAQASEKVSSSATEQASAIQETVATLNEITAMVNKSVDNARISSQKAGESHKVANQGKKTVEEMVSAIGEINGSNDEIMKEMTRSNQEIALIVNVIKEISEKTKVINDIVFQTKLLSFNASVEAARAGEHGKGFAVVAEEVGNLAQMSGNASREIEDLLSGSIKKVESIVEETQGKVSSLITTAKTKINNGVDVANRCGTILDSVVVNVESVTQMMAEISSASEEQAEGINNITTAMNELDEATHSNSNVAVETSDFASELSDQNHVLNEIIESLENEVLGKQNSNPNSDIKHTKVKEPNFQSVPVLKREPVESNIRELPKRDIKIVKSVSPKEDRLFEVDDDDDNFPSEDDPRFKEVI